MKICTACNELRELKEFSRDGKRFKSECKSCRRKIHKQNSRLPKYRFQRIRSAAKSRGIEFSLTLKDVQSFANTKCTYCGDALESISLDRVDSNKGYNMQNVTQCCITCNRMKLNYGVEYFLIMVEKIYLHSIKGKLK